MILRPQFIGKRRHPVLEQLTETYLLEGQELAVICRTGFKLKSSKMGLGSDREVTLEEKA